MSPLQWALLILGAAAIVALYFFTRRERPKAERVSPDLGDESPAPPVREKQLDIFNSENQQFDEFGVGKPRRIAPQAEMEPQPEAPVVASPVAGYSRKPEPAAVTPPRQAVPEKIISLLISEREGTHIMGTQVHRALERAGLKFGARQIYHRLHNGEIVFSVASLLKPGILDPQRAADFSTPGLALFMVLPGPQHPLESLRDMLAAAENLAKSLNAEIYDAKRKQFTAQSARVLLSDVEAWARANPGA